MGPPEGAPGPPNAPSAPESTDGELAPLVAFGESQIRENRGPETDTNLPSRKKFCRAFRRSVLPFYFALVFVTALGVAWVGPTAVVREIAKRNERYTDAEKALGMFTITVAGILLCL